MKKHRIGIIGCGWIARFYAHILPRLQDRTEVVWVADLEAARAGEIARQTGAKTLVDYRHGLAEVDAVFILLPHHLHRAAAVDSLEAGCHVLLEKPLARTIEETDAIIAAVEKPDAP